ncbi:SLATT domain-containing protein [Rothia sp. P4278]|uniref:SLATT domain-containing protein n=1 Tax=Rothia sp. P4278 TaxID=3402658 RepID=UPI003AE6FAC3
MKNKYYPFDTLCNNSYITYKARIKAHQRIRLEENIWNFVGIFSSFILIILSIVRLMDAEMVWLEGKKLDLIIVALSIQLIIYSVFQIYINSRRFAEDMFKSYNSLHKFYLRVSALQDKERKSESEYKKNIDEYNSILETSANHTPFDYYRSLRENSGGIHNQLQKSDGTKNLLEEKINNGELSKYGVNFIIATGYIKIYSPIILIASTLIIILFLPIRFPTQ